MKSIVPFFKTAVLRQLIKERRERGEKAPWSDDYVLNTYRFCNVHRRDDRVSKWIIENIFSEVTSTRGLLWASYVCRWLNKVETLERVKSSIIRMDDIEVIKGLLNNIDDTVFGAAYIIQSPTGMSKIDGICWAMGNVTDRLDEGAAIIDEHQSMEKLHKWLMQFPHMGPFMAYQVVCDLTYTLALYKAHDRMTWTCAGPGAARGLGWLVADEPGLFNYNSKTDQERMMHIMQGVLQASKSGLNWKPEWGMWELATVQHWSCEFDKWNRGQRGENLKRRYVQS